MTFSSNFYLPLTLLSWHAYTKKNFIYTKVNYLGAWLKGGQIALLTHWGRVTHICVVNLTIIGPDNGLSPGWRQAIIWTNAGILLIGPWGTNFSEILIGIQTFSFKKMQLKMSSAKWRPFCLGPNVLIFHITIIIIKLLKMIFRECSWDSGFIHISHKNN